jgi:hypothetical protein
MSKLSGVLQLMIYGVLMIFGGITAVSTNVIGQIATITDPFTSFFFVLVSLLVFFGIIPYFIWINATSENQ